MRPAVLLMAMLPLIAQDHPVEGNPKSAVRVIAYEHLQCPDCATYRQMMDEQLLRTYGANVAFEHRDFPLAKHNWAKRAALAARHFHRIAPALGIEFRRWAMAHLAEITPENFDAKAIEWAKAHGTTLEPAALNDAALVKLVDEEYQEGVARGVARTPTVFVNGEPFIETFTVEAISKGIDTALAAVSKQ